MHGGLNLFCDALVCCRWVGEEISNVLGGLVASRLRGAFEMSYIGNVRCFFWGGIVICVTWLILKSEPGVRVGGHNLLLNWPTNHQPSMGFSEPLEAHVRSWESFVGGWGFPCESQPCLSVLQISESPSETKMEHLRVCEVPICSFFKRKGAPKVNLGLNLLWA